MTRKVTADGKGSGFRIVEKVDGLLGLKFACISGLEEQVEMRRKSLWRYSSSMGRVRMILWTEPVEKLSLIEKACETYEKIS